MASRALSSRAIFCDAFTALTFTPAFFQRDCAVTTTRPLALAAAAGGGAAATARSGGGAAPRVFGLAVPWTRSFGEGFVACGGDGAAGGAASIGLGAASGSAIWETGNSNAGRA